MQRLNQIHEGRFLFDPQDPIYVDHFPGRPVVPGSLIIAAFMSAARSVMAHPDTRLVRNFRFRRFISPGSYAFRMQRSANGGIRCSLFDGDQTVASGTLEEQCQVQGSSFNVPVAGADNDI